MLVNICPSSKQHTEIQKIGRITRKIAGEDKPSIIMFPVFIKKSIFQQFKDIPNGMDQLIR